MPVGIALSGGAAQGDFEVGALVALYNRGIRPDIVTGTSVGAINGAAIAQGEEGLSQVQSIWFSLQSNSDMYRLDPTLSGISDRLKAFLSGTGAHFAVTLGMAPAMGPAMPLLSIAGAALFGVQIQDLVDLYNRVSSLKSLFNLDPIRDKLRALQQEKVMTSGIKLRLAMVSLESGKLRFVNEQSRFTDDNTQVNLADAVIASCSIPLVFPPQKLGSENFIDGGVRNTVPIQAALDAGADQVYAICAPRAGVDPAPSFDNKNLLDIAMRAATEIMPDQVLQDSTRPPQGWGADVRMIQPEVNVNDGMTIDPGLIRIAWAYGYMRAADMSTAYPGPNRLLLLRFLALSELARQITEKRKAIWIAEYDANFEQRPANSGTPLGAIQALRQVRAMKLELKALVEQRQADFGAGPLAVVRPAKLDLGRVTVPGSISRSLQIRNSGDAGMPPGVESWWTQWEAHPWQPYQPTPWGPLVLPTGIALLPATPPPPTVSLADLFLGPLSLSNPAFAASTSTQSVSPGQSATITVTFTPTSAGVQQGTLDISCNDPENPVLHIPLTAEGVMLPPTISVDSQVKFGLVLQGETVQKALTITNLGSSVLAIQSLTITSSHAAFSAPPSRFPLNIAPLANISVQLQFAPQVVATFSGTLTIQSNDPAPGRQNIHVTLSGQAVRDPV